MFNEYDSEWQRTHDIESKASSSVGFTGIIFTLVIGTISSFLVATDATIKEKVLFSSIYSIIAVFLILSFMVLSIVFGMMALTVKSWKFPQADKFIETCKEEQMSYNKLLSDIFETYVRIIVNNKGLNNKISSYVKMSHLCFILSIILIAIYFLYILNSFN